MSDMRLGAIRSGMYVMPPLNNDILKKQVKEILDNYNADLKPIEPQYIVDDLVRCRECKYSTKEGGYPDKETMDNCVICTKYLTAQHSTLFMPLNGFCSNGRRNGDYTA